MLNEIIEGIAMKLNQVFGDGYTIYTESVEQGLKEPCFFIFLLTSSNDQIVGNRYIGRHPFDIHFFPSTKNKNSEILGVVDTLNNALEYVTLGSDLLHGTKMHYEIVDGVLHFFVEYNFHIIKSDDPTDPMEDLTSGSNLKG